MPEDMKKSRNIIFFYHKNHKDRFNGTSVYDEAMLKFLEERYHITVVEPANNSFRDGFESLTSSHYFVGLVKEVYFRQIRWLVNIFRGRHLTPSQNTILLVEDIYSAPIPLLVSKLKGYKLLYRAADFGKGYSHTLFDKRHLYKFIYSTFRRLMEYYLVKNSEIVICPSKSMISAIRKRFKMSNEKFVFLPFSRKPTGNMNQTENKTGSTLGTIEKVVLLFLGDFRYPPNYNAGNYVINEMVPKLNGLSNNYVVLIAGPNSQRLFKSTSAKVKILGTVDDTENLFSISNIGLAPMKTAGGLSMKIVDYLIHGLKVIATPEAANGIEADGQMRIADFSDFHKVVGEEIVDILKEGYDRRTVSESVASVYMTDKWERNLIERIDKIWQSMEK